MPRLLAIVLLLSSALAVPAMASSVTELDLSRAEFSRVGMGLRIEFGGAATTFRSSLAITSTGQMRQHELTLPIVSLDLSGEALELGTLFGLRLRKRALKHQLRLLELPEAVSRP